MAIIIRLDGVDISRGCTHLSITPGQPDGVDIRLGIVVAEPGGSLVTRGVYHKVEIDIPCNGIVLHHTYRATLAKADFDSTPGSPPTGRLVLTGTETA
jgi:hypothetical protein